MELFANWLPSFTMNLCIFKQYFHCRVVFLFVYFYVISMWLMDYADFLHVSYMKNKLKMIYCVSAYSS